MVNLLFIITPAFITLYKWNLCCYRYHAIINICKFPILSYLTYNMYNINIRKKKTNKKQNIEAKRVLWRPQQSYNRLVSWSISNTKRIARIRERETEPETEREWVCEEFLRVCSWMNDRHSVSLYLHAPTRQTERNMNRVTIYTQHL